MKKLILSAVIIIGSFSTYSQEATKAPQHKGEHHGERMEMRFEKMSTSLELTPEQQEKVKALMASQKEKMHEQRKENHESFDKEMKNILTEEQYTKWVAEREEMKKAHESKSNEQNSCKKKDVKKQ